MLKLRPAQRLSAAIVLISIGVAFWVWPQMPYEIASHWNAAGEVNGHMSRFWGVFLMPIIAAVMWGLLLFLPIMDPRAKNIEKFQRAFDQMVLGLFVFMVYVFVLTVVWNFDIKFNMSRMMMPALGLLFILVGRMVSVAEPNFTAGIRTPWTLSSDTVWRKTHDLGGKLFMGAGALALLGFLLPGYAIYLVLVPIIGIALFLVVYSFYLYREEQKAAPAGESPPLPEAPGAEPSDLKKEL